MPTALIVGASRGLGLGLAREFLDRGYDVIATARDLDTATELELLASRSKPESGSDDADAAPAGERSSGGEVTVRKLDIEDSADVAAFARKFDAPVDVLFVNAGVSGPHRKTVESYTDGDILHVFRTNAVGPVRLAKMLRKHVDSEHGVIAFMTSMMGSQALNTSGGAEIYRASKAALNSFVQSFIAEIGDTGPSVLTLHPGWVKTDMGGENAPLDVETSVKGLADVVEGARQERRRGFYDYAGNELPW